MVVDQGRGVRLLGINGAHVLDWQHFARTKGSGWQKFKPAPFGFDDLRAPHIFQKQRNESRISRGIEQSPFSRAAPHCCERVRVLPDAIVACPSDGKRHDICCRLASSLCFDQRQSELRICCTQRNCSAGLGRDGWISSFREPAPACKEGREHVAFENRSRPALQERPPPAGENESFELSRPDRRLRLGRASFRELEPEEPVRGERNDIRRIADSWKSRAAEKLKGNAPAPRR